MIRALHKAALHCEFQDLDDVLINWIICGVRDIRLQWHLLAKPDLTLQQAIEETLASETAEHSTQEISKASSPPTSKKPILVHLDGITDDESYSSKDKDVHGVKPESGKFKRQTKDQSECAGCGGSHPRSKCHFRDAICQHCSRKGQIAKVCQSAQPLDTPPSLLHKKKPNDSWSTNDSC